MGVQGPFCQLWWFVESEGAITHVAVFASSSWQLHYEIDILAETAPTPTTELPSSQGVPFSACLGIATT